MLPNTVNKTKEYKTNRMLYPLFRTPYESRTVFWEEQMDEEFNGINGIKNKTNMKTQKLSGFNHGSTIAQPFTNAGGTDYNAYGQTFNETLKIFGQLFGKGGNQNQGTPTGFVPPAYTPPADTTPKTIVVKPTIGTWGWVGIIGGVVLVGSLVTYAIYKSRQGK